MSAKAFYFKYKRKYINGDSTKDYTYYKFSIDGRITSISMNKRTLSSPQSITIPEGFTAINESEFEQVKKDLGF